MLADESITEALKHLKEQRRKLELAIKALEQILQGPERNTEKVTAGLPRTKPSVGSLAIEILKEIGTPMKTIDLYSMIELQGGTISNQSSLYTTLSRNQKIRLIKPGLWGLIDVDYKKGNSPSIEEGAAS